MDETRTTIELFADVKSSGEPVFEQVLVDRLGDRTYRVVRSPGLVQGLAAGDRVEVIDRRSPTGVTVLERAGNVCLQVFCAADRDDLLDAFRSEVEVLDGWLDGLSAGLVVFTVPIAAGFPALERLMSRVVDRFPGTEWLYGNVYDPADPTKLLNWWL